MPTAPKSRPKHGKSRYQGALKQTPQAEEKTIEFARTGLPLAFAAAPAGVAYQTLVNWRRRNPKFFQAGIGTIANAVLHGLSRRSCAKLPRTSGNADSR